MKLEKIFSDSVESYLLADYIAEQIIKGQNLSKMDLMLMVSDLYFDYIWTNKRRRNFYPEAPQICIVDNVRETYLDHTNALIVNHHNFIKEIDSFIKECKIYSYTEEVKVKKELKKVYDFFVQYWDYYNDKYFLIGGFYSLHTIDDFYRLLILEIVGIKLQDPKLEKYWNYYINSLKCPIVVFNHYDNKCLLFKGYSKWKLQMLI